MKDKFDFSSMKKAGIYPKDMKHTDYEGQAKVICRFLGLDNIYDYGKYEIRCHLSYARNLEVNENGRLTIDPFITVSFPNGMHI